MSVKPRTGLVLFVAAALLVTLALAAFAGTFASSAPDGLAKVAIEKGFDQTAKSSAVANSPFAHYAVENVKDEKASTGLAGVAGVAATLLVAAVLFGGLWLFVKRRASASENDAPPSSPVAISS